MFVRIVVLTARLGWMRRSLTIAGLLLGQAWGAASPFATWAREMEEAGVPEVAAHVAKAPLLARVWFHGHLADLAKGDERARAVGAALADDQAVTVLAGLDATSLQRVRSRVLAAVAAMAGGATPDQALGRVRSVAEAHGVCYGLLFDAHLKRARLAGWGDTSARLAAARRLAALLSVVGDDLTPWRTMAAWVGQPVVPDGTLTSVARMETRGMNAMLTGQPLRARRHLRAAWYAGSRDPLAPVWLLGAAAADDVVGREDAANEARSNVIGAIRAGPAWLQAALRVRVLAASIAAGDVETAHEAIETLAGGTWRRDPMSLAVYDVAAASPLLHGGGVAEKRAPK